MAKNEYIGINGIARKVKAGYIGINGIARKVKAGYIGINGIAYQFYSSDDWKLSTSGRKFKRHDSLPGTIMQWDDNGIIRNTLILDAQYRIEESLCTYPTVDLKLTTHTNTGYSSSTDSYASIPVNDPTLFTDASLNAKAATNQDKRNSTAATDEWQNSVYSTTAIPAVDYVRNTLASTSGIMTACDLPTINCLTRIFGDMVIIDSMDPTVSEYSQYALSTWFGSYNAWSSSWYGYDRSNYAGIYLGFNGYVGYSFHYYNNYIIPVLEL